MDWELITTPNPNEKALRVWVDRGDVLNKLGSYTAGVTTLKDFGMGSGPEAECGEWVYTYPEGPDNTGRLAFHFAMFKTPEQMRVPFDTHPERMGNHRWPDMLKSLSIIPDYSMPQSANIIQDGEMGIVVGPSYRIADEVVPEINEGSLFYVEDFQAHTWFDIPRYRVPHADSVSVAIPGGGRYNHPECWHPKIEIAALATASATFIAGSEGSAGGSFGAQLLPATNFQTRRAYWMSDEQVRRDGVVYRRRVRVRPPRSQRSQFRLVG